MSLLTCNVTIDSGRYSYSHMRPGGCQQETGGAEARLGSTVDARAAPADVGGGGVDPSGEPRGVRRRDGRAILMRRDPLGMRVRVAFVVYAAAWAGLAELVVWKLAEL